MVKILVHCSQKINSYFQEIVFKNIQKWGTAFGSSRNANIQFDVFVKAEKFLANFLN